jgi:hypothetical protein
MKKKKRTPEEKKEFREWFRRWFGGFGYGSPLADRCHTRTVVNEYGVFLEGDENPPTPEEWLASLTPAMRQLYEQDKARAERNRAEENGETA